MSDPLESLLYYLARTQPEAEIAWNGWQVAPVSGGANNLIFRARNAEHDLAVKFTIRDSRDRAGREYGALKALAEAGLALAPEAIWLDRDSFRQPVVVQSWLDGEVLSAPPRDRAEWNSLIAHYAAIHALTPEKTTRELPTAVLNFQNGDGGKAFVLETAQKLPAAARPDLLQELLPWFEAWEPASFPPPPLTLCRVDANWRNFIRRKTGWASVDWENSGWGDPAFEIAGLMTHPAYEGVSAEAWQYVIETYTKLVDDPHAIMRIRTYYVEMLMWWVIRWARFLYEIPRGLDERLAPRPDHWQAETERKLALYATRLESCQD